MRRIASSGKAITGWLEGGVLNGTLEVFPTRERRTVRDYPRKEVKSYL
jgi:hypothetical protein